LINIIPNTFVGAFSEGNILQVLFIAVLSGFALVWIGERAKPLVDIIEIVVKMIFVIVNIVMWTAPLDIWHQVGLLLILLVTSKGAAGVAGAAFVVLAATLGAESGIPVASVALILGIHRLMSQGLTPTNFLGNAVATIVMAKWEGALDEARMHRVLDERALERDLGSIAPASL
jgi:Na+/H+-dicarboxylate symporter